MSRIFTSMILLAIVAAAFAFAGPFASQPAPLCGQNQPQILVGDWSAGGMVRIVCRNPNNRFNSRLLFEGFVAWDIAVVQGQRSVTTYLLGLENSVRRIVTNTATGEQISMEWPVGSGEQIIFPTEAKFEMSTATKPQSIAYRIKDGEISSSAFGSGRKLATSCYSFAKIQRGDEFCTSRSKSLLQAPATYSGANWSDLYVLYQDSGIGGVATEGNDVYLAIDNTEEKAARIVRFRFPVGFGGPEVTEVLSDKTIAFNTPLAVARGKLYFVVYVGDPASRELMFNLIEYDTATGQREVVLNGLRSSYFGAATVVPPGTFGN